MTDKNGLKIWIKRMALATAIIILFGLVLDIWIRLDLPRPAMAADVKNLNKRQAGIGIELYRDRENDLIKVKREYRWKLQDLKREAPKDHNQHQMVEAWIDELDIQIETARKKRTEFEDRKIFLERTGH